VVGAAGITGIALLFGGFVQGEGGALDPEVAELFFTDQMNATVFAQAPYSSRGNPDTTDGSDNIYGTDGSGGSSAVPHATDRLQVQRGVYGRGPSNGVVGRSTNGVGVRGESTTGLAGQSAGKTVVEGDLEPTTAKVSGKSTLADVDASPG
jgi:hypothetical protein